MRLAHIQTLQTFSYYIFGMIMKRAWAIERSTRGCYASGYAVIAGVLGVILLATLALAAEPVLGILGFVMPG